MAGCSSSSSSCSSSWVSDFWGNFNGIFEFPVWKLKLEKQIKKISFKKKIAPSGKKAGERTAFISE